MRKMILVLVLTAAAVAQTPFPGHTTFETRPAVTMGNDKLELTIGERGGPMMSLVLLDDPDRLSPLWNPVRMARELGRTEGDNGFGTFVCVDGFGVPSAEERRSGLPTHGEAYRQPWEIQGAVKNGKTNEIRFHAHLPLVQENFTRTMRMVDGENVVYVESALDNELAIDRPVSWAEHTTLGAPFLEPGVTLSNVSGSRAQNRPYTGTRSGDMDRRLVSAKDFTWPMSPGLDGSMVDLTAPPLMPHFVDHATVMVDPSLTLGWIATVQTSKHLVIGYIFKRAEYPWVMNWDSYPPTGKLARGLEFSTQPYDESRADSVARNPMFGAPTFRWLPAKGTIKSNFILFYAHTPEGFGKVESVKLENGQIVIDDVAKKRITLGASLPF